jgi:hypothetical protein
VPLIVEKTEGERIQQNPTKMTVKDFFLTMHFLKCYDVEEVMAGEWGYDEKTLRIKTRAYQRWIQVLAELKIVFGGFEGDEIFWCSVDGVHCMIFEPRKDPSSKWFSHKSNGAGLTYEVACAIRGNRCVWVRGPFPASQHDITTFRGGKVGEQPWDPAALINLIPEGKRAIADSGLKGEPGKISVTREGDSAEVRNFKARAKSRQETFHTRLKAYKILSGKFRHRLSADLSEHKRAFEVVTIACQYNLENGHGLFEI